MRARRSALAGSTALVGAATLLASSPLFFTLLLRGTPAFAVAAEGGTGGANAGFTISGASGGSTDYSGGTGAVGTSTATPAAGTGNGVPGAGGGGGGAGSTGGDGGPGGVGTAASDIGGALGAGGTSAPAGGGTGGTGGAGSAPNTGDGGGGGGGGGAHGYYGATLPTASSTGGAGGQGGNVTVTGSGAGGGGAGASGLVLTGAGSFGTLTVNASGGAGGAGGTSVSGFGGSGGAAGYGIIFTDGSSTVKSITIGPAVTVQGGNGGLGGTGGAGGGDDGRGASAITGSSLAIMNSGSIVAGTGADSHAINFTGGANTLTLTSTGTITGDIAIIGVLSIDPNGVSRTLANVLNDGNGGGSVEKIGAGTLVLTGANGYSGGTTVSAGVLAISGSGTLGASNATTTVQGGTLDLGGTTQTQNGGVTLTSGTIQNGILSSLVGFAVSSGTVSAVLDGAGAVSKTGSGTVTFTAANTYAGGTTVTAGTLRAQGSSTALGTGLVTLDGGTLQLGADTAMTFGNDAAVTTSSTLTADRVTPGTGVTHTLGALTIGGQTLSILAGPNVTGGTAGVTFGAATLTGNATFNTGAGTLLTLASVTGAGQNVTFDGPGSTVVPGAIDIAGGTLTKTGSGTLGLTGTSVYTGPTAVTGGTLNLNGSIANSVVTVGNGATLGGNGTMGGLVVQAGGIVSPGNSIGQLNVSGNVLFGAGSIYRVELNASGGNDKILATGTGTLSGGTVQVLAQQGNYAASTRYTILTTTSGLSGTFAGTTSNLAFLRPNLTYDASNAYLTMDLIQTTAPSSPGGSSSPGTPTAGTPASPPVAGPIAFSSVAATTNQASSATAVQRLGAGNPVYDAVLSRTAAQARQAFDAVSGEAHASQVTAQFQSTAAVRENVLDRLRGFGSGPNGLGVADATVPAAFAADLPGGRRPELAPVPFTVLDPRVFAVWGRGFGSFGSTRTNGSAGTLTRDLGGFVLGADATLDNRFRIGAAGGYTNSSLDVTSRASSGGISTAFGGLYGAASFGALTVRVGGTFASDSTETHRSVAFPGFTDSLSARFGGTTLEGFGEVGYRIGVGSAVLEPFVGAAGIRISENRFTEVGGPAALTVAGQSYDTQTVTVGARGEAAIADGSPFSLKALLGYRRAFGTTTPVTLLAFAAGGQQFATSGIPIDKDAVVAEAGVNWQATGDVTLGLAYTGQAGARAQDHGVKGNLLWRF